MSTRNTYLLDGPLRIYLDGEDERHHIEIDGFVVDLPREWMVPLRCHFWHPLRHEDIERVAAGVEE